MPRVELELVSWGGFEPPIFSLGVRCSIQLSYQDNFLPSLLRACSFSKRNFVTYLFELALPLILAPITHLARYGLV